MGKLDYVEVAPNVGSPNGYSEEMDNKPSVSSKDSISDNGVAKDISKSGSLDYVTLKPTLYAEPAKDVYYTGNIAGRNSGIKYGDSKYDKDISFYDLNKLDAARADQQGFLSSLGNGLLSRTLSILPKTAEGFGFVATAPSALINGDVTKMADNPFSVAMANMDNQLRKEFPVYASDNYNASVLSKMGTRKFWFDDFFDGLAFSASAFVPAGILGRVGEVLNLGEKGVALIEAGNKIGGELLKNVPEIITTTYNVMGESGFEARDNYKTVYADMIKHGKTPEEAKSIASKSAAHTYTANLAILALPDAIETKFFMGGFKKGVKSIQKAVQEGLLSGNKASINVAKEVGQKVILGMASEGAWEEGIQNGVQQWEQRAAENSSYNGKNWLQSIGLAVNGDVSEYIKGFSTNTGITSMVLGAITGGLMGGAFTTGEKIQEKAATNKYNEEWASHIKDVLNRSDEFFKSRIIDAVHEDGKDNINGLAREIFRTTYDKQAFTEVTAAMLKNDKFHHSYNQKMNTARMVYSYLADNNFDNTDLAFKYAMDHLDKIKEENKDAVDDDAFAQIKKDAQEVKDTFDALESKRIVTDKFTKDKSRVKFGRTVDKTILYEKLKQNYLNEIKPEINISQHDAIDGMIKDSENLVSDLYNTKKRDELYKDFNDYSKKAEERLADAIELKTLEKEFADNKDFKTEKELTKDQKEKKLKRYRDLLYKTREDQLINGERIDSPLDSAIDSNSGVNDLRNAKLGIINEARLSQAMRYKKNAAIDQAIAKYYSGKGSVSEVLSAIRDNTSEMTPYTREDINTLKSLLKDAREVSNSVDTNVVSKYKIYKSNSAVIGEEEARKKSGITDEEIKEAEKAIDAKKNIVELSNIINSNENKANLLPTREDLKNEASPDRLQGIAMSRFINESTENILSSYKNNPDTFSDVDGVQAAWQSVIAAEDALNDKNHEALKNSEFGKKLAAELANKKVFLENIFNEAVKNESDKQAQDIVNHGLHGKVLSYAFIGDNSAAIKEIVNKHLGAGYVENILDAMALDNDDPIYIEKIIKDIKKLDPKKSAVILSELKSNLEKESNANAEKLLEIIMRDENVSKLPKEMLSSMFLKDLDRYKKEPVNYFKSILAKLGIADFNSETQSPFEKYASTGNFAEFVGTLADNEARQKEAPSGLRRIDNKELIELVKRQARIVSLDNLISSVESEGYDRADVVSNEKHAYNNDDTKIHPSRQQRISIANLVRWFKSKNKVDDNPKTKNKTMHAFAYLRGIAGSGKTTVVAKNFLLQLGIKNKNILSIANNASSLESLNKSISTDSQITTPNIKEADITDDIKIIIADEIGAASSLELKNLTKLVNKINEKRRAEKKDELKVLLMGDPTQISGFEFVPAIESRGNNIYSLTQIHPLTTAFRSNVSDIVNFQMLFMNNRNEVTGVTVTASNELGKEAIGVHVSNNRKDLITQLKAGKDNGKSKVIIVSNQEGIDRYKQYETEIPNIQVLTVEDVQGRTFDETYIDLDLTEYDNNLPGASKLANNKRRNKIIYTAVSRASDYIFMVDGTASFKNKTSDTVEQSKKYGEESLANYDKEYGNIIDHDLGVLNTGEKPPVQKESPTKNGEEIKPTTTAKDGPTPVGPDVYGETDESDNTGEPTETETTSEDEAVNGKFKPVSKSVHTLDHPQSIVESVKGFLGKFDIKSLINPGDKVYYVLMNIGGHTRVAAITEKTKDGVSNGFFVAGYLNDNETKKYVGRSISELEADKNIESARFIQNGQIRNFDENNSYVLKTGKVTGTQALTYIFKKATVKGKGVVKDAMNKVSDVFNKRRGFKLVNAYIKIRNYSDYRKAGRKGPNVGVPYLYLEYEGKNGGRTLQHVKLSPRMLNFKTDSALINPLIEFKDVISDIEKEFNKEGVESKFGSTEFNRLIKKFKENYRINSKNELELKDNAEKITFEEAKEIVPTLTETAFRNSIGMFENVIPMLYGVGEKRTKVSVNGFEEFVKKNNLTKSDPVDGKDNLYFAGDESTIENGKGRYYQFDEKTRYIKYWVPVEKDGDTKLQYDRPSGYVKKYVTGKDIVAETGAAQQSLNSIAKNNEAPNGVNIRTRKALKKKSGNEFKYITGKSLTKGENTYGEYLRGLRALMYENLSDPENKTVLINPYQKALMAMSSQDQVDILESTLIDKGIATREELDAMSEGKISTPLTLDDLNKVLESNDKTGESTGIRLPLDMKDVNELGKDLSNKDNLEELDGLLEHNLSSVVPTRIQVELNEATGTKQKEDNPTPAPNENRRGHRKPRRRNMLESDEVFNKEETASKELLIKEIKKRIPGIKDSQIKFIADLLVKDPITGKTLFARGSQYGKNIFISENENDTYYIEVAKHEVFHYIKENVLSKEQYSNLINAFGEIEGDSFISLSDMEKEEFIARKYQQYHVGDYAPERTIIRKIFDAIKNFLSFSKDNKEYIENLFKGIENGKFQTSNQYSVGDDIYELRKKYGTTNNFKQATTDILSEVESLMNDGFESERNSGVFYPVPDEELYSKTKTKLGYTIADSYERVDSLIAEHEAEKSAVKRREIENDIDEELSDIHRMEITMDNFKAVFDVTYPSWGKKITLEGEDTKISEKDLEKKGVNVNDDVIEWERVNMEQKISSSVKNKLANIFYKDYNGDERWVNPKYAYLKTLEIFNETQPENNNFGEQLAELKSKEQDPAGRAVIAKIEKLYYDVRDYESPNGKARTDIRFFNGDIVKSGKKAQHRFTFVMSKNGENVYKYNGLSSMETLGLDFNREESTFATLKEFVDYISDKYNISKDELFNAYSYGREKNTLSEIISNFNSQRRRDIRFVYQTDNGTFKSFKYFVGAGRTATSTSRTFVRENMINKLSSQGSMIKFTRAAWGIFDKANRRFDAKKNPYKQEDKDIYIVTEFLKAIGLGGAISKYGIRKGKALSAAAGSISYLFGNPEIITKIITNANTKFDPAKITPTESGEITDEMLRENEDNRIVHISGEIIRTANTMINSLGDVIDVDSRIKRPTSVKAADGKRKYIYVISNQAIKRLNTLINIRKSGLFEGTSRNGSKLVTAPEFINSSTMKHNIFKKGISYIYGVFDHDGTRTDKTFRNERVVVEYKDEKLRENFDRSFSAQFIDVIRQSTSGDIQYVQSPYVVSNKPVHNPVRVSVLKHEEQRNAIESMLKQIVDVKEYEGIDGFDKTKLINLDAFATAIEKEFPGSITEVLNKKDGSVEYSKLSEESFQKLSDIIMSTKKADVEIKNRIIDNVLDNLDEDAKNTVDVILSRGIGIDLNSLLDSKVLGLLTKEERKSVNTLKLKRSIDPNTGEIVFSKDKIDGAIRYKESQLDVRKRIAESKEYGKHFTEEEIHDYVAFNKKIAELRKKGININTTAKSLISRGEILPVVRLFIANDYIQSNQLTQISSGDYRFFKGPTDLVKRLSGAFAPGIVGNVNDETGMPTHTNVAIIEDPIYDRGTISDFLRTSFGVREEDIPKIAKLFGDGNAEYADGQGFMTPERYEELVTGFGETYGLGSVMKPAYYHIDENGVPRMLKYSSIVITDDLVKNNPLLGVIREKMRSGKAGEIVFKSGIKVGSPKNLTSLEDLLSKDGKLNEESMFAIDNNDYRMQLNPLHSSFDSVANPTQLTYFLNTAEHNQESANNVFNYASKIVDSRLEEHKVSLSTKSGIYDAISSVMKNGRTDYASYELITKLKKDSSIINPWDFPQITIKSYISLNSFINKHVSQIRFTGTKAILQTAFGTEQLDEETRKLANTLNYNHEKVEGYDNKDVMYAETIFPSGLLPKSLEDKMKAEIEEDKKNGGTGVAKMEFLTPDALGFRLPSSELHSAVPLRIKGFYDSRGTNVIIAPRQIVDLHGSDYDVDSLFTIIREYEKDENGKRTNKPVGYELNKETNKYEFNSKFLESKEFNLKSAAEKEPYYKNGIIENIIDVISKQENRDRMASPIAMGFIKDDISDINRLRNKNKRNRNDLSNFLSRQRYHSSSYEASTAVGIWANGIKTIAYLQRTNDGENPELYALDKEGKIDNKAFMFDNEIYSVLSNSEEMYRVLDGFLNSTIDNVKEQDLPQLNMTSQNIRGYIALMAFGFDMKSANRIFAQDIISYSNKIDDGPKVLYHKLLNGLNIVPGKELNSIKSTYDLTTKNLEAALGSDYGIEEIINKLDNKEVLSKEERAYAITQLKVLGLYNHALDIGKALSDVSKILAPLRETPVREEELARAIKLKNNMIKEIGEGVYKTQNTPFNFSDIMNRLPHLKSVYDVIEFQKELGENNFFIYNKQIKSELARLHDNVAVEYDSDPLLNVQKMYAEFSGFVYKQVRFDPEYRGFQNEKPVLSRNKSTTYYNERAFSERMVSMAAVLKLDPRFKDNLFVQALEITKDNKGRSVLRFPVGSNMDYVDVIDFQNAFNELINYKVVDGKVEEYDIDEKPEDETLGFSELQKDFFRLLIVDGGLTFSPDSYIQVMPIGLKAAYHKSFESMLYNKETGILVNKKSLRKLMAIYETNLAVNHPEHIKIVRAKKTAIHQNEENDLDFGYKEVLDDDTVLKSDLAFKPAINKDGNVSLARTKDKYPLYVRTSWVDNTTHIEKSSIYKRVIITTNAVMYQKIGGNNFYGTYTPFDSNDIGNYSEEKAFNPIYRHVNISNLNETSFKSMKEYSIGETIGVSTYSDAARVNQKYVKITGVKSKKDGGKIIYTYQFEYLANEDKIYNLDYFNVREYPDDTLFGKIQDKHNNEKTYSLLNYIKNNIREYAPIADILMTLENTRYTTISDKKIIKARAVGGMRYENDVSRSLNNGLNDLKTRLRVDSSKHKSEADLADTLIHEEIHRYTSFILTLNEIALQKFKDGDIADTHEYLKEVGLSENEIKFADRVKVLHEQFLEESTGKDNIHKEMKNVSEFIAYGLTDESIIEELDSIKVKDKSLFREILDAIASLFGVNNDTMYNFLYTTFKNAVESDNGNINKLGVNVKGVVTQNAITDFINWKSKSFKKEFNRELLEKSTDVLDYKNELDRFINDQSSTEFQTAALLENIAEEYPDYGVVAKHLLRMNKSLLGRINDAKLKNEEIGSTDFKRMGTIINSSVVIDRNFVNSLNQDPEIRKLELVSAILHEEVHRYTAALDEYKNVIDLKPFEKQYLHNMNLLLEAVKYNLDMMTKYNNFASKELLKAINNDVSELVAYGVTDPIAINYFSGMESPLNMSNNIYKSILKEMSSLFEKSSNSTTSVFKHLVQSNKILAESLEIKTNSEEDLQRNVIKCGM